jgi:hypothetical protein
MIVAGLAAPSLRAQAGNGTVEGRVQDRVTGDYLNNARITVKGTNLVALTDSSGFFTLSGVPAGSPTLDIFFTGLDRRRSPFQSAGQTARQDIKLTSRSRHGGRGRSTRCLHRAVNRETRGAMVNEQRCTGPKRASSVPTSSGRFRTASGELMKWHRASAWSALRTTSWRQRARSRCCQRRSTDGMPVASASTATASVPD